MRLKCSFYPTFRVIITNGGLVYASGGCGSYSTYHNSSFSNTVNVTGVGSMWDCQGTDFSVGKVYSSNHTSSYNVVNIDQGGSLTNCKLKVAETRPFDSSHGQQALYNRVEVVNGGKLYATAGDSFIGMGNSYGAPTNQVVVSNGLLVSGGEYDNSLVDIGNKNLYIGYQRTAETGIVSNNIVRVLDGGVVTNINNLYIGSSVNGYNSLSLEGGMVDANSMTLYSSNKLDVVIDNSGLAGYATVSGTATLGNSTLLSPSATEDGLPGTYTVLTAGNLVDNGIGLDPAIDNSRGTWSFVIEDNTLYLTYAPPGPLGSLIIIN